MLVVAGDLEKASVAEVASDVVAQRSEEPAGSPERPQRHAKREFANTPPAKFKSVYYAPNSQIPMALPDNNPEDGPDEGMARKVAKACSLDTVVAGEPAWVPAINSELAPNERLPSKSILATPMIRKETTI